MVRVWTLLQVIEPPLNWPVKKYLGPKILRWNPPGNWVMNINFQWTKTLYQNNLKNIAFFLHFSKAIKILLDICSTCNNKENFSRGSEKMSVRFHMNRPFALRGIWHCFYEMKVIWFCLWKTISGSYLKQNNGDLVYQTRTIFLK